MALLLPRKLLWLLACWSSISVCSSKKEESQLIQTLFANYSAMARPVLHPDNPVNVDFDVALRQLLDVDEKNQVITTSVWLRMYWVDPHLKWNETEWSGITFITVTPSTVWRPDITLYNNAEKNFFGLDVTAKTRASIYSSGNVVWLMPMVLLSDCKMSMLYFPFDTQACPFKFGSWAYDSAGINFFPRNPSGDLTSFRGNDEFQLVEFKANRESILYGCCPNPYVSITYIARIERRIKYYLYNLILPAVLISLLSCVAHLLPPLCGERIGLVITTFLSLSVYMLLVSESVPASSDVIPLLVRFYTAMIGEVAILLIVNCIIIRCASYETPVPPIIHKLVNGYAAPILFCRIKLADKIKATQNKPREIRVHPATAGENTGITNFTIKGSTITRLPSLHKTLHETQTDLPEEGTEKGSKLESELLKKISRLVEIEEDRLKTDDIRGEWEQISYVLDRLFLVFFIIVISFTLVGYLAEAPKINM